MTKSSSHLHEEANYESVTWRDSRSTPGVRFATRRVSLGRRIELNKNIRELMLRHEFLKAGETEDKLEASLGELLVRKLYLEWGLKEISGLKIDGEIATADQLIERGPEALTDEVIEAVQAELALSDDERKNS
ncbi:MAG: hypothetical protein JO033_27935 [Acidobacteriaceae bacterium]|nr:hypothetical protein [Acidobacteriaceae bacterium]MBV9500318.1 hypothetical protein [Acidobacteriaceae bacterium]